MSTSQEDARPASKAMSIPSRVPPGTCFHSVVTIEVGPEEQAFVIHKDLLCYYSDYFSRAFQGSFKEATEGKISLTTETIDDFTVFNKFIYTRRLGDDDDATDLSLRQLCRLWVFGDKYSVPSFQNLAMDTLIAKTKKEKIIPTSELHYIYDNTPSGSPLRKLLIDRVVNSSDLHNTLAFEYFERWSLESMKDLALACHHRDPSTQGTFKMLKRDGCYYHVHGEGEHC